MKLLKMLFSFLTVLSAETEEPKLTVYNQDWAYVQEQRVLEFENKGQVDFIITIRDRGVGIP